MSPRVVRTKTTELIAVADGRFQLLARLTDVSHDCDWGPDGRGGVIHDFEVEGEIEGEDLIVTRLGVRAVTHPYASCPAIVPGCAALVGRSLASGWRRTVLEMLGGTTGCTHVTSLLVGLAEVRTSVFFLRMNQRVPYTPSTRAGGAWTAAGLEVAPGIVGACHALTRDGPVIASAEQVRHDPA
jgi:hypothetical protein